MPIHVDVTNEQDLLPIEAESLARAVRLVLQGEGRREATISVAVLDDAAIRPLNAKYLGHDYATDVLSFVLEDEPDNLEGEIVVSAETALASAPKFEQSPLQELLLYVIHGALHLVGYNDLNTEELAAMRERERRYMLLFLSHDGDFQ